MGLPAQRYKGYALSGQTGQFFRDAGEGERLKRVRSEERTSCKDRVPCVLVPAGRGEL